VLPHKIQIDSPPYFSRDSEVDRFVASLAELAAGDILGARVEFCPHQNFVDYPVRDIVGGDI